MRRLISLLFIFILLHQAAVAQGTRLTVFAAASLTDAMNAIDQAWVAKHHPPLRLSFASSSTLARQLDHGANASLFASADEAWMNWVAERHLVVTSSRRDVVSNQLVLVVPKQHSQHIDIKPGFDLAGLLGPTGRLALGDPTNVPAGRYAKQALTNLGSLGFRQQAPGACRECSQRIVVGGTGRGARRYCLRDRCGGLIPGYHCRHLSTRQPRSHQIPIRYHPGRRYA